MRVTSARRGPVGSLIEHAGGFRDRQAIGHARVCGDESCRAAEECAVSSSMAPMNLPPDGASDPRWRAGPVRGRTATEAKHTPMVVRAISLLEENAMTVTQLARALDVSRAHLQRVFTRLVGCTPAAWQRAQRSERLRTALKSSESVSSAAFDAGFDSLPSAYAAASAHLGMSPGALRRGAAGEMVFYTVVPCALGFVLVAMTSRGVHRVILGDDPLALDDTLRVSLPAAELVRDDTALGDISACVVALASGAALSHALLDALPLDLRGTVFQQRVWRELQRIPRGETITYAELAARIGAPTAVRAVGTACGANPVAMVVPCHRVVRADGSSGGYAWGLERKARLLRGEKLPTP